MSYINDVDVGLNNLISTFADDTKTGKSVLTDEDRLNLQKDLHTIPAWSERWEIPFNIKECQVLQVGVKNKKCDNKVYGVKHVFSVPMTRALIYKNS